MNERIVLLEAKNKDGPEHDQEGDCGTFEQITGWHNKRRIFTNF